MSQLEKIIYTGKTRTSGGRNGSSRSSDGRLDIQLSYPGTAGAGTNPEQLFAAGWSACFIGAIGKAAQTLKVDLAQGSGARHGSRLGPGRERLLPESPPERVDPRRRS